MGDLLLLVLALLASGVLPVAAAIVAGFLFWKHFGATAGVVTAVAVFVVLFAIAYGMLMTPSQSPGHYEGAPAGQVIFQP